MNEVFSIIRVLMARPINLFRVNLLEARLGLSNCLIALLHKLAVICLNNAYYSHALIAYQVILRVKPNDRFATIQLVNIYSILDMEDELIQILENWLQTAQNDLEAHIILSELYAQKHEVAKAREHLNASSRIEPNSPALFLASGIFYRWEGSLDESSEFFRSALRERRDLQSLSLLAQNLIDQGKKGEAISILEKGVRLSPDVPFLYYLLARCRYYRSPSHPHIIYMRKRIRKDDLPAHVESIFHFALGEAFDSLGQWDEAFAHFKAANDLQSHSSDVSTADIATSVDQLINTFNEDFFSVDHWTPSATTGESLIFILGTPRSGTTLVEQILASHPDVHAGGERNDISIVIEHLCSSLDESYPACVRRLDHHAIDNLARMHLSRVIPMSNGVRRFVDKSLGNWHATGLITSLFPKAKLVHCKRNPLDTCLSCYFTYLPQLGFTSDLMTLGVFYRQYERLMFHWHSVISGKIFDLQYEDLVSDPEMQIRKLLDYCELSWHDGCLNPHQTERVVLTASASQVKLPIHAGSVGRWQNYEKYLRPLIETLNCHDKCS